MLNSLTTERLPVSAWEAKTALLHHQSEATAKLLPSRIGALFMEMGTGKSRTAIELARIRQKKGKIDCVVWFCPVSLKRHVRREILKHTNCTEDDIYLFGDKTAEDTIPLDSRWYIVGIESMSSSTRALYSAIQIIYERSMVIMDESTYIKGHRSLRTQRITSICETTRYRLLLTGTPVTQGAVDLYSQMRFLSWKILGYKSFYTFAANHLVYSDRYPGMILRSLNVDWLAERIKPYVYQVTKDECLNLPPKQYDQRYCWLTDDQQEAYQKAKDDFCDDLLNCGDDYTSNSLAIFRLFTRLQGIVCGFSGGVALKHNRIDLLREAIAAHPDTHTVIWTKFRRSVDQIAEGVAHLGNVFKFDGRLNETARDDVLDKWKAEGGYLVATQSLGGHGLDFTESATAFFYSCGFKFSEHIQAEDRNHRIGQVRPVTYIELWTHCGIEDRIRDALRSKEGILEKFRSEVDKVKTTKKDRLRELVKSL
ncbi:MAG: SNF2-related protein [Cellulomonas sp.]